MQRSRKLNVERGIVFRVHEMAVGLFAHFDVRDWVAALFDVRDFVRGVFGDVVDHRDGNHGGQAARVTARVEEIEANLITDVLVQVARFVPRIDRGTVGHGLILIGSVADQVVKLAVSAGGAEIEFANGVAETIALVGAAMRVARVGRPGHQNADVLQEERNGAELENGIAAFSAGDGAAGKSLPDAERGLTDGIFAREILNDEMSGVRLSPLNANGADQAR